MLIVTQSCCDGDGGAVAADVAAGGGVVVVVMGEDGVQSHLHRLTSLSFGLAIFFSLLPCPAP